MSWPAPDRVEPAFAHGERAGLEAWLDYHRDTLLVKSAGLTPEQLATRSCPPSQLSLLGLLRHLAEVERHWFRRVLDGQAAPPVFDDDDDEDRDVHGADPATADADLAVWRAEVAAAREVAARLGLDDVGRRQRRGQDVPLRWVYMHLVEEYARHNGHADLLRERVDGATGE